MITPLKTSGSSALTHTCSVASWKIRDYQGESHTLTDRLFLFRDKRCCHVPGTNDKGELIARRKLPDETMGLVTYTDEDLEKNKTGEISPRSRFAVHAEQTLSRGRLEALLYERECGLVADANLGKVDLAFPFVVYEAKKAHKSAEDARAQIFEAMNMYVAMGDDLARNPENLDEYQTDNSRAYQVFGLTSCGSRWEVYYGRIVNGKCVSAAISPQVSYPRFYL
jgi:hypothetical protein